MHNSFADAYQRSWLLQTILVSHFNGYILIAIYIMFKGKRNAPRLNYNNQLVLEKVSTMHLVSYTPLVEKQCILWQKNGRKHPGAPKYILQDIETKQVSLFFFFFFFCHQHQIHFKYPQMNICNHELNGWERERLWEICTGGTRFARRQLWPPLDCSWSDWKDNEKALGMMTYSIPIWCTQQVQ